MSQRINMLENYDQPKHKVVDFVSAYSESKKSIKERVDSLVKSFLKNYIHEDVEEIEFSSSSDGEVTPTSQ